MPWDNKNNGPWNNNNPWGNKNGNNNWGGKNKGEDFDKIFNQFKQKYSSFFRSSKMVNANGIVCLRNEVTLAATRARFLK